ncbi:MAG: hypothetical protein U9N59_02845 [Campylobacterota bacterium]|nr:hypothetical protein [Campylobacterota bacterium]
MSDLLLPEIVEDSTPSLLSITKALGVSRDIVASDDEITEAWRSLPSVIKKIPPELVSKGLARMCIAVASGLFDSAINYIWNASVIELRNKMKRFGLNIVEQVSNKKDFDENKLNDLKDSELLELSLKLNLITEDGFFFLDQCRDIRNNFSAAHPTIGDIDNHEFISYVNRCAKYALGNEQNPIGVNIQEFITALKLSKFTDEQLKTWIERLEKTHEAQRELLFGTMHGIYCDSTSSEETRVNALNIIDSFKEKLSPTIKSNLIDSHQNYLALGKTEKHVASQLFFEKLGLLELLGDTEHHALISNACKRLWGVHQSMDNFYNEPPFAERLLQLSTQGAIPKTAKEEYVTTIVGCSIGNQYGTSNSANIHYKKMIQNFSPDEIRIMLESTIENTLIKRRIEAYGRCRTKFKQLACLIDRTSVSTTVQKTYEHWSKDC